MVSGIHEIDPVLEKIELSTLLFFAGLFVLMRALEELGLMEFIADIVIGVCLITSSSSSSIINHRF